MLSGRFSLYPFPDMHTYKKTPTSTVSVHIGLKFLIGAHVGSATPARYPPIRMKSLCLFLNYYSMQIYHKLNRSLKIK
jgi:hypothetical protein